MSDEKPPPTPVNRPPETDETADGPAVPKAEGTTAATPDAAVEDASPKQSSEAARDAETKVPSPARPLRADAAERLDPGTPHRKAEAQTSRTGPDEEEPASPAAGRGGGDNTASGKRAPAMTGRGWPAAASGKSRTGLVVVTIIGLALVGGLIWWAATPTTVKPPKQTASTKPPAVPPPPVAASPPAPVKAGAPDTGKPSATPPDSGQPAAAPAPEAGKPDTAPPDTGKPAATPPDAGNPAAVPGTLPPGPPRARSVTDESIDTLKRRGEAGDTDAMEELARRYIEGVGVTVDAIEGAKWLQRAAERGAPSAMFNVGVMFERGMVLDKDPAKALEWYARASAAGVPMATHNMALMYREGIGVPVDQTRALRLLLDAAHHGMSASMYALGTMYEAGSYGVTKDQIQAIVWYAMALQFQRAHPATQNSDLAQRAELKVTTLQRILPAADLQRAQAMGESEYRMIIDTIRATAKVPPATTATAPPGGSTGPSPSAAPAAPAPAAPSPAPPPPSSTPSAPAPATTASRSTTGTTPAAPSASKPDSPPQTATAPTAKTPAAPPPDPKARLAEIQTLLATLRLYTGKPDGIMGPMTRTAIKDFQRMAGLPQTGEPSEELIGMLREQVELTGKK